MPGNLVDPTQVAISFDSVETAPLVERHSGDRWLAVARAGLILTLTLATFGFGAVQPWAWGAITLALSALLIVWALSATRSGLARIVWTPLYLPAALFLMLGLLQFSAHLTADSIATREALLKLVTNLMIFFLALNLWAAAPSGPSRRLGLTLAILAGALALFGTLQFFASPDTIYGVVRPRWGGWIFGPYVNHNHFAGLMEMLIPIALCYLISIWARWAGRQLRLLLIFGILIAVASVLLSGSRGGVVSLAVEIIILGLILWRRFPGVGRRSLAIGGLLGLTAAAGLFLWLDPGQVSKRLVTVANVTRSPDATFGERRLLARDSLRIFRDHPWLGTGLGSFATVYPRYRSFPSDLDWDHAHNDYAEALAEAGIIGGLAILAALILFFRAAFRDLHDRLGRGAGWIRLGAALGCCGLLVHSLVDFNLHIPANAAWFSLCAGLAVCPDAHADDSTDPREP
ncbi:MAG TPA: O-antigen ligase [Terriglobia bacterium]